MNSKELNLLATFEKNKQYWKFCGYGFLKNLRFYDVFLLLFFVENEISFTQIGILYAAREITTTALEVPSGLMADAYGRKNALIAAFVLYILSYLFFYFSTDFALLLIAMLLMGVGDAFRSGSHKGMIMDYLKINGWQNHKVNYYGHTRSWSQIGSALSALFAGGIVFYSGDYRTIYLIAIAPYLLNFINIYSYPNELNYSARGISKNAPTIKSMWKTNLVAIRKKEVLEIINSSALHSAFLKAVKDYIQPLMINLTLFVPTLAIIDTKKESGLAVGIMYFFIFLLTAYASKVAGKLSALSIKNIELKTLLLGLFAGLLCGILFHYEFWFPCLLFFVSIYFIENLRKPILTGELTENVPNEILTSVISTQSLYKTFMTAILSVSIGILADFQGIGMALLAVSMFLLLFTMLMQPPKFLQNRW